MKKYLTICLMLFLFSFNANANANDNFIYKIIPNKKSDQPLNRNLFNRFFFNQEGAIEHINYINEFDNQNTKYVIKKYISNNEEVIRYYAGNLISEPCINQGSISSCKYANGEEVFFKNYQDKDQINEDYAKSVFKKHFLLSYMKILKLNAEIIEDIDTLDNFKRKFIITGEVEHPDTLEVLKINQIILFQNWRSTGDGNLFYVFEIVKIPVNQNELIFKTNNGNFYSNEICIDNILPTINTDNISFYDQNVFENYNNYYSYYSNGALYCSVKDFFGKELANIIVNISPLILEKSDKKVDALVFYDNRISKEDVILLMKESIEKQKEVFDNSKISNYSLNIIGYYPIDSTLPMLDLMDTFNKKNELKKTKSDIFITISKDNGASSIGGSSNGNALNFNKRVFNKNGKEQGFYIHTKVVEKNEFQYKFVHELGHVLGIEHENYVNYINFYQRYRDKKTEENFNKFEKISIDIKNNGNTGDFSPYANGFSIGVNYGKYFDQHFFENDLEYRSYHYGLGTIFSIVTSLFNNFEYENEIGLTELEIFLNSNIFFNSYNKITIMGYPDAIGSEFNDNEKYIKMFSNPEIKTCLVPNSYSICGANKYSTIKEEAADAVSSLKLTIPEISSFRTRYEDSPIVTESNSRSITEYLIGSELSDQFNSAEGGVDKIWASLGQDIISLKNKVYFYVPKLEELEETIIESFTEEDRVYISQNLITDYQNQLINDGNNLKIIFPNEDPNKFVLIQNVQKENFIKEQNLNTKTNDCYNSQDKGELCQVVYIELKLKPTKDSNELVLGSDTNDTIVGNDIKENIEGNAGNDVLTGGYNADILNGGSGDDTLGNLSLTSHDWLATDLDDYYDEYLGSDYIGGTGNDSMYGSRYGDTYYFNKGDGVDYVTDFTNMERHSVTEDSFVFGEGILPEDLEITREDLDVRIANTTNGDVIYVLNGLSQENYQIEYIFFKDSNDIWTWENDIVEKALDYKGTPNSETINALEFYENKISGLAGSDQIYGKEKNDSLYGNEGNDTLEGRYGFDKLYGGTGNDILGDSSTSSEDFLGNDGAYDIENSYGQLYEGGTGDDIMYGTRYGDTYIFNKYDEEDSITENSDISLEYDNALDKIIFNEIPFSDMLVSRNSYDVTLTNLVTGDIVIIKNGLKEQKHQIEIFDFADRVLDWNEIQKLSLTIYGTSAANTLRGLDNYENTIYGRGSNDYLYGANSSDTIYGEDGADRIYGYYGYDYLYGGSGNDTLGKYTSSSKTYKGTNLPFDPENSYGNYYDGGIGNDRLYGSRYGDTYFFDIGHGSDIIRDKTEYETTTSTIDRIVFGEGIYPNDLIITAISSDLFITYTNNSTDKIEIEYFYNANGQYTIEEFIFHNGATWTGDTLLQKLHTFEGTEGNDDIDAKHTYGNIIRTGAGDDKIQGGDSIEYNDHLYGESGNDNINGGYGYDYLYGGEGDDIIGSDSTSNSDYKGNNSTTIDENINYGNYYEGGSGNDTLKGTRYGDTYMFNLNDGVDVIIEKSNANSTLGTTQDTIEYGYGINPEDIIIYREGYDLFLKNIHTNDTIQIDNFYLISTTYNYQIEFVKFKNETVWDVNYLIKKGLILKVSEDHTGSIYGLDFYEDIIYGNENKNYMYGKSGNDTLYGQGGNDLIVGDAGADILYGEIGDDTLDGGLGYDKLYGGEGNDILGKTNGYDYYGFGSSTTPADIEISHGNYYNAGTGNDTLNGTRYGDTYFFDGNFGNDIIQDKTTYSSELVSNQDSIVFGENINKQNLIYFYSGNNIFIKDKQTESSIRINNMYTNPDYKIENVTFFDGTTISYEDIMSLASQKEDNISNGYVSTPDNVYVDYNNSNLYIKTYSNLISYEKELFLREDVEIELPFYWERINGLSGNDVISGGVGYFEMNGGEGNDHLGYLEDLTCSIDNYKSNSLSNEDTNYINEVSFKDKSSVTSKLKDLFGNTLHGSDFLSKLYYISSGSDYICGSRYGDTYRVPAEIKIEENPDNVNITVITDTSEFIPTEEYNFDTLEFLLLESDITVEYFGEDVVINTIGGKIVIKDSKNNPLNRIEKFAFSSDGKTFNNFLYWDDIIAKIQ